MREAASRRFRLLPLLLVALASRPAFAGSAGPVEGDVPDHATAPGAPLADWVDSALLARIQDPELRRLARLVQEGRATKPMLRAFFDAWRLGYPFEGTLDGSWRLRADAQLRARERAGSGTARLLGDNWQNMGPIDQGGRTTAIALDPTNPYRALVGAADGGVWRLEYDPSTKTGTWTALFDREPSLSIGALAIDPTNPSIVYVGTGEQNFAIDNYSGVGLIKSLDGGRSWLPPVTVGGAARIGALAVRPDQPQVVFAGTSAGLQRSTDAGQTWTQVLGGGYATDVVLNPRTPDEVYVGIQGTGTSPSGIWKSTTGGGSGSFTQLSGSGACTLPVLAAGIRVALAIAESSPDIVYAAFEVGNGQIWKTTNSGATWCQTATPGTFCGSQCWYDMVLGVDPTDPNNVLAGGVNIYRSTNGGTSWSGSISGIHVDHHAIRFMGSSKLALNGNDGGLYVLDTTGSSTGVTNLEAGYVTIQYYGMAHDPSDPTYAYGGTQDNGTHKFTAPSGDITSVRLSGCGDGAAIRVHPTRSVRLFHTTCPSGGTNFNISDDRGATVVNQTNGIVRTEGGNWVTPVEVADTTTMYTATSSRVYKSTNANAASINTISWSPMGTADLTPSGSITTIASTPADALTVWAGTSQGRVYITRDGTNWTEKWAASGGATRYIGKILASETDRDAAWITLGGLGGSTYSGGHVFETNDGGDTWIDRSGDLPDVPVNSIVQDDRDPDHLWIGTWLGAYETHDRGATWAFYSSLPKVAVAELALDRATRTLYAATHGRGMWRLDPVASGAPRPVPDGVIDRGEPMYAAKQGTDVLVTWDASGCPGNADYHLFYGDILDAGRYTYTAGVCNLGITESAIFPAPAGSVYWLMAGQNAAGQESGHRRSGPGSWVPASGLGLCTTVTGRDASLGCP